MNHAINRLEEVGAVKVLPGGEVLPATRKLDVAAAAEETVHEHEQYRQYRVGRVELMRDYAQTRDCRQHYLLNYFGEQTGSRRGHCDNCETGVVEEHEAVEEDLPFPLKSHVVHSKWGRGVVMGYEEDKINVQFDTEGAKSLVLRFVLEHSLLKLASATSAAVGSQSEKQA